MAQVTLLTGPERRRRWSDDDRREILTAAFAPGAVVSRISRQFEVSTSLIYKWREQAMAAAPDGRTRRAAAGFAPAVMVGEGAISAVPETAAIIVELANGARLRIGAQASAALVTATLRALR
jgi:transposase